MSRHASRRARAARLSRDRRVWLGVAVTLATLWLALRGVDFRILARDMARANLALLFGLSIPLYVLQFYLRALRWRHLTDAVRPIARAPLFRATAIGLMANNVFPLRVGEVVRAWYLAREVKSDTAPLFGTVVLERVIDAVVVVALAIVLLGLTRSRRTAPRGTAADTIKGPPRCPSARFSCCAWLPSAPLDSCRGRSRGSCPTAPRKRFRSSCAASPRVSAPCTEADTCCGSRGTRS
jgi:hypothetical protein